MRAKVEIQNHGTSKSNAKIGRVVSKSAHSKANKRPRMRRTLAKIGRQVKWSELKNFH